MTVADNEHVLHYVPGEVCVVVEGGHDPDELWPTLHGRLNEGIAGALGSQSTQASGSRFDLDLSSGGLPAAARLGRGLPPSGGSRAIRVGGSGRDGTLTY